MKSKLLCCAVVLTAMVSRADAPLQFPVEGNVRYVLAFRAGADARYEVRFLDEEGLVRLGGIRRFEASRFASDEAGVCRQEFYAPSSARKMSVAVLSGRIDGVTVQKADPSEWLNVNPLLKAGSANYSGYSGSVQCTLRDEEERCLEVGKGCYSLLKTDPIPVRGGASYRADVRQLPAKAQLVVVRPIYRDVWGRRIVPDLPDFKIRREWHPNNARKCMWQVFPPVPVDAVSLELVVAGGCLTQFGVQEAPDSKPLPPPMLTKGNAAYDEIIVPDVCGFEMTFAAQELQKWIGCISGSQLPIYHGHGHNGRRQIRLETAEVVGTVVSSLPNGVRICAAREEGVVTGVFQLLERNTDIVFPRPDFEGEAVYTKNPNLKFEKTDFTVVPAWKNRKFGLGFDYRTRLWLRRNYVNSGNLGNAGQVAQAGDIFEPFCLCYEFGRLLANEKYFDSHPEFYAMVEGERKKYGSWGPQICYTCEEGRQTFMQELFACIERDVVPSIRAVSFDFADSGAMCCCENCKKPIELPDGTKVDPKDEAFRSTQYFMFLNKVVDDFVKRYPNLTPTTLGYIQAAIPPKVAIHPRLEVTFCPYPKDDKVNIDTGDINTKWGKRTRRWAELCGPRLGIYEYWGDAAGYPRAVADAATYNLRLWNSLGINSYIYSEAPADDGKPGAWDVSAMEFWTLLRLMVDPSLDAQRLRVDYLKRAYGPSGKAMAKLYTIVQGEWRKASGMSWYADNAAVSLHRLLRQTERIDECRRHLDDALKAASDPRIADLIRRHREWMEKNYRQVAKDVPDAIEIPVLDGKPAPKWGEGDVFVRDGRLHVRMTCTNGVESAAKSSPAKDGVGYPLTDRVEVMVGIKGSANYYHFVVSAKGEKYEARGYDHRWTCEWNAAIFKQKNGWRMEMSVPLDAIGLGGSDEKEVGLLIVREQGLAMNEKRHNPDAYPEYRLKSQGKDGK